MENESILVSVFPLAFIVVDHFTTLPLPTMGLFYSTYKWRGQAPGRNGGRLGEYKYYDMDKVIASALEMSRREL